MRGRSPSSIKKRLLAAAVTVSSLAPMAAVHADPLDDVQNLLLAVEGFSATGIGEEQILVTWTRVTVLARAFRIEYSRDEAGPYVRVPNGGTVGDGVCDQRGRCITQIKLGPPADPTPAFFRVVPFIALGAPDADPGSAQSLIEGKPSEADPAMLGPRRPTDVRCNGGGPLSCVSVNSITLSWTDNSDEDRFWVMRGRGATNVNFGTAPYAELPADTTSFSEVIPEYGVFYTYRIVAVRERAIPRIDPPGSTSFERSFTNGEPSSITVETAPVPPPSDPNGLAATFVPPDKVLLTWIDGVPDGFPYVDEDGFFIEQTISTGDFESRLASQHTRGPKPGQGAVSFTTRIPANTLRCYRVRGYRSTTTYTAPAYSGYTNTVCMGAPPSAPINLRAKAVRNDLVTLDWNDTSDAETGFVVQRCLGTCVASNVWTDLDASVPANTSHYDDASTFGSTFYSYRVRALNPSGRSKPSNIVTVKTPPAPLPAPTGLVATATGSHEITLTWNDTTSVESGFKIEYRNSDGVFVALGSTGANVELYIDSDSLPANQQRCYRVRAFKQLSRSDPSQVACATTLPPAAPNGDPTIPILTVVSNTEIQVQFDDTATNEDAFEVEMFNWVDLVCPQNPTGLPFRKVITVNKHSGTGVVSQRISGLVPHTAHVFRVRAVNEDGDGGYSPISACADTFGPKRPVFIDPEENADTQAMRCDFTIKEPMTGADGAGGMRIYVNSVVTGTPVAHTDTLYVVNGSGTVPGAEDAPDRNHYLKTNGNGLTVNATTEQWTITYQFRRGINYRIIATAYGLNAPYYASAATEVRDVTVVADCPTSGI